jgi:protein AATF/BFR2
MAARSVSAQLQELFSPKPKDYDPETLDFIGGNAHKRRAVEDPLADYDESKESEKYKQARVVRSMKAQPAMGEAYRGKKASRSDLGFSSPSGVKSSSSKRSQHESEESDASESFDDSEDSERPDGSEEDSFEINLDGSEDSDLVSGSDGGDMSLDGMESVEDNSEDGGVMDDAAMEADELEKELMNENEEDDNLEELQRLKLEASEELTKAQHALNQRVLWDAMLDLRLKLQAPQSEMNRFPVFSDLDSFLAVNEVALKRLKDRESEFDTVVHQIDTSAYQRDVEQEISLPKFSERCETLDLSKRLSETRGLIKDALADMMTLQQTLLQNNDEIHDEILQDEGEVHIEQKRRMKRKEKLMSSMTGSDPHSFVHGMDTDDLWDHMEAFQISLQRTTEQTIDRWARKALYAGDLATGSKFKAVNQNISVQVDQVMANKDKVLQRTRLKREEYHVLGNEEDVSAGHRISAEAAASGAAAAMTSDQHNPEIFDDSDFCQILLKDILESGLSDTSDPIELTRRFLALRTQRKSFKKAERKPSKGKTLKYAEQPKLVAFMAPVPNRYPMHDAYVTSQLILSLFGQKPVITDEQSQIDADSDEEVFSHSTA